MGGGGGGGSHKESSRQSKRSRSHSRTSSRGGSASPDGEKRYSCSCLPSPLWRVDEDRQDQQSSLDFESVVTTLRSPNELPEAPSEGRKVRGFRAALEDDGQPASSYKMPVHGASADILAGIDNRVSSPSLEMRSKKVSKLLQCPGILSRKFYWFEGEDVTKAKALNCHVTELAGLCSYENLNKTDME